MDNIDTDHDKICRRLYRALKADPFYAPQIERIMAADMEMSPDFLGFVGYYYYLSKLIPRDRVIYDMGCCSAVQAYYFRHHHSYIGVDLLTEVKDRITQPNAMHFQMTIKEYLDTFPIESVHFAICNYVPPWHGDNQAMVRAGFKHVFVYYPESREPFTLTTLGPVARDIQRAGSDPRQNPGIGDT